MRLAEYLHTAKSLKPEDLHDIRHRSCSALAPHSRSDRVTAAIAIPNLAVNSRVSSLASVTYSQSMQHAPEDSALMLRYKEGDAAAFEILYHRHSTALYRYLLGLCRQREVAEDVFQDAWNKIVNARHSYRPTAKFRTFLFRVAHNCFIDHVRRNKRHLSVPSADPDNYVSEEELPETSTEKSLARRRLDKALGSLPEDQRDAFLLHEEGGLSIQHIAQVTGVNRETAKSRLRYAFSKLRQQLSTNEDDA